MNNPAMIRRVLALCAVLAAIWLIGYVFVWQWMFCRIEVPAGNSLLLRYKGPFPFAIFSKAGQAPEGTLVEVDDRGRPLRIGILRDMPGPGRHFYSPLEYERQVVPDIVIEPGKVGIVTSRVGKPLPAGAILADEEGYRGTWRRVLTPGRYRLNSYAYKVETLPVNACVGSEEGIRRDASNAYTLVPPGYVGVVTNKADNPAIGQTQGIQPDVLQPGLYFLNPYEKQVDIIGIGFSETSLDVKTANPTPGDERGDRIAMLASDTDPDYVPGEGIEFPSNDGFLIHMDYTAIWGVLPGQAPDVVRSFGTLEDVEDKVVLPQIGSICRLYGSKRGAVDLLVGDKREVFQEETATELQEVLESKKLTLRMGLTRHIYVPSQVREPIQKSFIADEMKLTADQKQLTARAQADLTEAKAQVTLEERRTMAETLKLVAELKATGEKQAREIEAETERLVAEIDAETAVIDAEVTTTMGEAEARKTELTNQAEAERYRLYVETLGGPAAYNRYTFAEGLPPDLKLGVFYAGPGTFWTDLNGFERVLLGKLAADSEPTAYPDGSPDPNRQPGPVVPTSGVRGPVPIPPAGVARPQNSMPANPR